MATKKTTTSQEDAVFESGLDEVMAEMQLSQADNETDQEDALSAAQDTLESSLIPQTDSEPLNEDRIPAEDAARNALPDIIPQTSRFPRLTLMRLKRRLKGARRRGGSGNPEQGKVSLVRRRKNSPRRYLTASSNR